MSSRHRAILLGLLCLAVVLVGCADLDRGDAERLFQQDRDGTDDVPGAGEDPLVGGAGNASIHFIDVGQGDGIVVHLPGFTAVYDTGRWYGESSEAVREHLQAEGADPDALVISHPDADHAGGCEAVLDAFTIEAIYHPGIERDTQTWRDCKQAMEAEGAAVHTGGDLAIGQSLSWSSEGTVQLLHVDSEHRDANTGSIVLAITHGRFSTVLAGDMTCEAEQAILDRGLVGDLDVVHIGHHGSSTSTCTPWLETTQPEAGVISVGGDNSYGHPHEEVLDRLAVHGVDVYRTDQHGTVEVTTNGTGWGITTETGDGVAKHQASSDQDDASNPLAVSASVSEEAPCQYTDVTVTISAEDEHGEPLDGANTTSTWHYKSSSPQETGTTNASGGDTHTRNISGASAGSEVVVDVAVDTGDAVGEAETSFTPRSC